MMTASHFLTKGKQKRDMQRSPRCPARSHGDHRPALPAARQGVCGGDGAMCRRRWQPQPRWCSWDQGQCPASDVTVLHGAPTARSPDSSAHSSQALLFLTRPRACAGLVTTQQGATNLRMKSRRTGLPPRSAASWTHSLAGM